MIALGIDTATEFAMAIYYAELAESGAALQFWSHLPARTRTVRIAAAERLIEVYQLAEIET